MRAAPVLFIVLLFLFLFIPHYGVQLVCCLLGIVILTGFLSSRYSARGLKVVRKEPVIRVYKGQKITIELDIQNHSIFSQEYLFISDEYGPLFGGDGSKRMVALKPGERCAVCYELECRDRGSYTIGPVSVRGSDVFGFFPWAATLDETTELIVYPALHSLDLLIAEGLPSGNLHIQSPLYEDVTRYRSLRDYTPGDDLRRIHWKVSAKMGDLYTKEFLPTYYFSVLIILNVSSAAYSTRMRTARIERSIETAAALVLYCLKKGQKVGLLSNGIESGSERSLMYPIKDGHTHSVQLLQGLARVQAVEHDWKGLITEGIDLTFGSRIFYVGPPMEDSLLQLFLSRWGTGRHIDFFHIQMDKKKELEEAAPLPGKVGLYRSFPVSDYGEEMIDG